MTKLVLTPLAWATAAVLAVATIAGFVILPAGMMLPVHWNIEGMVDATMPREFALLWAPVGAMVIWITFLLIRWFAPPRLHEGGWHVVAAVIPAITGLFAAIQVATILIGTGVIVDMVRVVSLGMAALLIVLGNVMPKSRPNGFAGIRIPSTMRDPANWQATHRLAGYLMIGAGVVLAVATLLMPVSVGLFIVLMACVLVPLIVATVFGLRFARSSSVEGR